MALTFSSPPKSICVLRLSAIGDVCHTLPVVRAIQDHWPSTQITWVIGRTESALVGDIPDLAFTILDKSLGWKAYGKLREEMKGKAFDLLLHMQVSVRSSLASRQISSPRRLGFDRPRARNLQWAFTTDRIESRKNQHVMDALFGFAEALGVTEWNPRWDIPIPESAREFAWKHVQAGTRTLVISPCSSSRARNWRNWRPAGYAAVLDHAVERHGMRVILTGGPTRLEEQYGVEITRLARHKPTNLIGRTGLKELLALLDKADVLVAPDSGPVHMATAVRTPVIGLYVTSNPMRTGPYFSQPWVVNKYPEALEAELGRTVGDVRFGRRVRNPAAIDRIRVGDVTEKLDRLIASLRDPAPGDGPYRPS